MCDHIFIYVDVDHTGRGMWVLLTVLVARRYFSSHRNNPVIKFINKKCSGREREIVRCRTGRAGETINNVTAEKILRERKFESEWSFVLPLL